MTLLLSFKWRYPVFWGPVAPACENWFFQSAWDMACREEIRNLYSGFVRLYRNIRVTWSTVEWIRMVVIGHGAFSEGGFGVNCARNTLWILGVWCVCCEMLTDPVFYRLWWKPESQGTSEWYPVNANPSRLFWLDGRTNDINHVAAVSLFTNKSPYQSVNINTGC